MLSGYAGICVPGGFGQRGTSGKVRAVQYAREEGIPFLGLCLGLQCAVIEFARNVCNIKKADSTEFDEVTPEGVDNQIQVVEIALPPERKEGRIVWSWAQDSPTNFTPLQ